MKFLSATIAKSLAPNGSLISLLKSSLAGRVPHRQYHQLHASDITKDDFCPRLVALLDLTKELMPSQYLPTALKATFDMGNTVADVIRNQWLRNHVVGDWRCDRCGKHKLFSSVPSNEGCLNDKKHLWNFREPEFLSHEYGVVGSIDMLVRLGGEKLIVVELKIISADEFKTLVAPLSEHRIRTSLYLHLIEKSTSMWRNSINLEEGRVLYVSRGHGKKHVVFQEVLPFLEFSVKRNDQDLAIPLQNAKKVKLFRDSGVMPAGICTSAFSKPAKNCPQCKLCFSGVYPAGKVL